MKALIRKLESLKIGEEREIVI